MNDIRYASGKLNAAAFDLVKAGDIRDRLYDAFTNNLGPIFDSDFPAELTDDFLFVKNAFLTFPPVGNNDNIKQSLGSLSDEEAEKVAEKILHLAFEASEIVNKSEGSKK